jgi:hypothetical protein
MAAVAPRPATHGQSRYRLGVWGRRYQWGGYVFLMC